MTIKISNIFKKIYSTFLLFNNSNRRILYRFASVDFEKQIVILHLIHKNIFIKKTLSEIVSDSAIIERLSCTQACWIGVYYGRALRAALDGKIDLKNIKKPSYLLKHLYGRYKIISENRDGSVNCLHVKTKTILTTSPLSIARDDLFINNFDVNQACYIGILAGISINKKRYAMKTNSNPNVPYLKLIN